MKVKVIIADGSKNTKAHEKPGYEVNSFARFVDEVHDIKYSTTAVGEMARNPHYSVLIIYD
ncbi:MAG TPA: hypothetical protein VN549_06995 [Negativicutes bacterium]|nr:hypothetical protein [Negativicutes bacterium]